MNKEIRYSMDGSFEKKIRLKKVIPYIVLPGDRYRAGKWYYNYRYNNFFKIITVEYDQSGELEEAYIKTDDELYSMISTDLSTEDFLIEKDKSGLYKEDIINSGKSYTGAEIVYWFFINDIDCFSNKYRSFWKFVDRYSTLRLVDNFRYFLSADINKEGNYIKCRAYRDIRKRKPNIHTKEDNEFMDMKHQIDQRRVRENKEKILFQNNNPQEE